jgi:hypothetical protein
MSVLDILEAKPLLSMLYQIPDIGQISLILRNTPSAIRIATGPIWLMTPMAVLLQSSFSIAWVSLVMIFCSVMRSVLT